MTNKVLILFGHPAFHKSRVNRALVEAVRGLRDVTFHDLYESYPDGIIDVPQEQALLNTHQVYVLQHPFYWYSVPSIFKEWFDLVLQYGYAYGPSGDKLRGKKWMHAITAGGPESSYRSDGNNRFTVRELLAPLEQTANLCHMEFLDPFVIHSSLRIDSKSELPRLAKKYRELIEALRDN